MQQKTPEADSGSFMIAKLTGKLDAIGENWVVIDVNGVGYMVRCSARTLAALPQTGSITEMMIETHVREDHIHLYGFLTPEERDWFLHLQNVQGVGTKVALAILDTLDGEDIREAIATDNGAVLTQATGVGARLAQRIVNELKGKLPETGAFTVSTGSPGSALKGMKAVQRDTISALLNLGYRQAEASAAVTTVLGDLGESATVEDAIRHALGELAK